MSIIVQQDATIYSLLYFRKLLYMFRVITPPIISSTYNCNYSIWHWSKRSLLPSAVVETLGLVQQDATIYSLLYYRKLLYMFRVVTPPIIRSTYNCNYSIWHWSKRSLLPTAVVETLGLVQQDATIYSLLYYCKLLYMVRVVTPPIIRSAYNCIYSIWYLSDRYRPV